MVKLASKVTLGKTLESMGYKSGLFPKKNLVAVKAPVSSMAKLSGADTYLGPEMKSTGEVMGVDTSLPRALFKALQAADLMMPIIGSVLVTVSDRDKNEAAEITKKLITSGYKVYATQGTAEALKAMDIPIEGIPKKYSEEGSINTVQLIKEGMVHAVVNTMSGQRTPLRDGFEIRRAATESGIPCYTSLDTFRVAVDAVTDVQSRADYNIRRLSEYVAGIE
jgi:carbamoyl-phosphate synthase large subunit